MRAEINKIEAKKTIQRNNETKSWFFEKINKIDKSLSKLIKRQKENIQVNTIINEKGGIATDPWKPRESLGNTTKTYTPQNWKM